MEQLAHEVASRVGCRGIGAWLVDLAATLGLARQELMPVPAVSEKLVDLAERGLKLTLSHPHAGNVEEGDPERWVITDAVFSENWQLPWPFGFDPRAAMPDAALAILGTETSGLSPRDIAKGDLRQTFFLADGRAIGITWRAGLVGIESMHICRLGLPMAFEDQRKAQTV